ncbi:MAG: response regulator [Thauera sp.]|nr:response regulator [Thauera sp.]
MPPSEPIDVLVVESQPTMRSQLRNMLASIGYESAQFAVSASTAIKRLRERHYDLILCEYHLGDGQDGQHLLEDLREHEIIPLETLFVMISSEMNYERVVSTCELAPNDYILKPLTGETLRVRLQRAFDKRDAFLPAWQSMAMGDTVGAIECCREGSARHPQYAVDFTRLQAELHLSNGQLDEAEARYREILKDRSIPWADLGLARVLALRKQHEEAEAILLGLVGTHERYIAAYDLLSRVREEDGRPQAARDTLIAAAERSPHRLNRQRRLGELALRVGDPAAAESSFAEVVRKGKYSDFADPEDHVRLVQAQLAQAKLDSAANSIADLERGSGRQPKGELCKALCNAMLHARAGDLARSREALQAASRAAQRGAQLSVGLRQELIKACFDHQLGDEGTELVGDILRTAADERSIESTRELLRERGLEGLSKQIEAKVQAEVKSLITVGAEKARAGDFDGAVSEMMNAARKMPGNPQVLFNAALALMRHIEHRGWNDAFAAQAHGLIDRARKLSPASPRLAALTDFMHQQIKRYGIRPGRIMPRPRPL